MRIRGIISLISFLLLTFSPLPLAEVMAQPKEIVLGTALPITGGQSREGGYFKKGYELAVKEINDGGGIPIKEYGKSISIKLIIYDDKSDNTTSVQLYEKLVTQDKVNALLGGYGTPLITAHTVVAEKYRVPYVNGGGATAAIYQRNMKYVFGTLASIEKLAHTLMDWVSAQQDAGNLKKPLKIAVMGENTSHGKEFRQGVLDKSKAAPARFQVVVDEPFELNLKDADPLLQKLKASNADVFRLVLARTYWATGNREGAYGEYSALVNVGEYMKETMADLETIVEIHDQTDWHRMLGDAYMKVGRLSSALEHYRHALSEI